MSVLRRLFRTLGVSVALLGFVTSTSAAGAATPIRPHQHYIGLINGRHVDATIYAVCPGPATLTRTGPPAGNQMVSVVRVRTGSGDTEK